MTKGPIADPSIEWGSGDNTIEFLHYFSGAAESWHWVAERLTDYRCIAINLPGFGNAPALEEPSLIHYADAVSSELSRLDVRDYVLVGHSMGGKIALQLAATSDAPSGPATPYCPPQQVVLVAPSPPTQEPMPDDEKQRMLNNHPSEENAETTLSNATQRQLSDEQHTLAVKTHIIVDDSAWRWWLLEGMDHSIA
ncbi:MAG: alpha/beta fold hydrolase, partial [Elainellaceae cyanobacterium]